MSSPTLPLDPPLTNEIILLGDAIAGIPDTRGLSQHLQNIRNALVQSIQILTAERDRYKIRAETAERELEELRKAVKKD
jgi:hypothetical protein